MTGLEALLDYYKYSEMCTKVNEKSEDKMSLSVYNKRLLN